MNYWIRFKSAITGFFVSRSVAEKSPSTTYGVKVKRKLRKPRVKP